MNLKAGVGKKKRKQSGIIMWIVAVLCVIALALIVYNIIMSNWWYVISYVIGIILGVSYILVSLNELYSTWIATDGRDFTMRCWETCFFPHQTFSNIKFIGELLPAKNIRLRIPAEEIKSIVIGTKSVIKRTVEDESFLEAVAPYENARYSSNNRALEKMDILHVGTVDNDSVFMCVDEFDGKAVMKVVRALENANPNIMVKLNGKKYRSYKN